MGEIFISYQNNDSAKAHFFCESLKSKGYAAWIYEKNCHGGKYHRDQVTEAIEACSAFIFIMTDNAILSQEVTYELQVAHQKDRLIFPVYFDRKWEDYLNIKTDWARILETRTGIDAIHNNLNTTIETLKSSLEGEGLLGDTKDQGQPVTRDRIVPFAYSGALDHFENRTNELELLKSYIEDKHVRMILLTGPGGYGKSALIQKLIQHITDNFNIDKPFFEYDVDSIIWLDLGKEETRSIDALFNLINKTTATDKSSDYLKGWNSESSISNKIDFLIGRLLSRDRKMIILDNLESILDDTVINDTNKDFEEFIHTFLNANHNSVIISASRRRLTLSPELEAKHGLRKKEIILDYGLPDDEACILLEKLDEYGQCKIGDISKERLYQVVQRIKGAPRILETLIGILKIEDRDLEDFLGDNEIEYLIANPAKELIESLNGESRLIMEMLSVFGGPVTQEAIQTCFENISVRPVLTSLKNWFLVKINEKKQYHLHPIDQKVVYEQISQKTRANLHIKAANWFACNHMNKENWHSLEDIQSYINETHHRIYAGEFNVACQNLNLIDREYLAVWNYYSLIIHLRREMLNKITDHELEELNYGNLACALFETGQNSEAKTFYQKALDISREHNSKNVCRWLGNLALMESASNNMEGAEQMLQEAYDIAKKSNNQLHIGRWQGKLATLRLNAQKISLEDCAEELESALKQSRLDTVRDRRFESYWLYDLYSIYKKLGENDIAARYLEEAIQTKHAIGDYRAEAEFLLESYRHQIEYKDPKQVIDSVEEAFAIKLKIGRQQEAYDLAESLADFYLHNGMVEHAHEKYIQILEFSREVGNHSKELHYLQQIGLGYFMRGDFRNSVSLFMELKSRAVELNMLESIRLYDFNIGDSYLQLLEFGKAKEFIEGSLGYSSYLDFMANYELALIHLRENATGVAEDHFNNCFKAYLDLSENNQTSHQIDFIYTILLMLREKTKEAEEKILKLLEDSSISTYTLTLARHDVSLAKKILPDSRELDKIEEILNDRIKSSKV